MRNIDAQTQFSNPWQKVLDKNLEPQGPTRVNYRGGKVRQQGKNRQGSLSSMIATAGE